MCFENKHKQKTKIADDDIICYKVLEHRNTFRLFSPYYFHEWKYGVVYETIMCGGRTPHTDHQIGFSENPRYINCGFHAYLLVSTALERWDRNKIYQCIIPRGSLYLQNDTEIVSNQMILVRRD